MINDQVLKYKAQNIDRLMNYAVKAGRDTAAETWVDRSCLEQNKKMLQPDSTNACSVVIHWQRE